MNLTLLEKQMERKVALKERSLQAEGTLNYVNVPDHIILCSDQGRLTKSLAPIPKEQMKLKIVARAKIQVYWSYCILAGSWF
jgi:hypothetical protein